IPPGETGTSRAEARQSRAETAPGSGRRARGKAVGAAYRTRGPAPAHVPYLTEEEFKLPARPAIGSRTDLVPAHAHGDCASSHQTTLPAGSWVRYQLQRVLSAATRNRPRPPSSSSVRSLGAGGC